MCLRFVFGSFVFVVLYLSISIALLTAWAFQKCSQLQHWYCIWFYMPKRYRQLRVKDLPIMHTWRLEWCNKAMEDWAWCCDWWLIEQTIYYHDDCAQFVTLLYFRWSDASWPLLKINHTLHLNFSISNFQFYRFGHNQCIHLQAWICFSKPVFIEILFQRHSAILIKLLTGSYVEVTATPLCSTTLLTYL